MRKLRRTGLAIVRKPPGHDAKHNARNHSLQLRPVRTAGTVNLAPCARVHVRAHQHARCTLLRTLMTPFGLTLLLGTASTEA